MPPFPADVRKAVPWPWRQTTPRPDHLSELLRVHLNQSIEVKYFQRICSESISIVVVRHFLPAHGSLTVFCKLEFKDHRGLVVLKILGEMRCAVSVDLQEWLLFVLYRYWKTDDGDGCRLMRMINASEMWTQKTRRRSGHGLLHGPSGKHASENIQSRPTGENSFVGWGRGDAVEAAHSK
jgi:hypothetical protein